MTQTEITSSRAALKQQDAHTDYRFAREVLGYSHQQAMAWLLRGYRTTERQLYRWGFRNVRTEVGL